MPDVITEDSQPARERRDNLITTLRSHLVNFSFPARSSQSADRVSAHTTSASRDSKVSNYEEALSDACLSRETPRGGKLNKEEEFNKTGTYINLSPVGRW